VLRVAAARGFARELDAVHAVTPYMRGTLERSGVPADRIFDLPYPAPFFDERRIYSPSSRPSVLFVGRLDRTKGPDLLLEACARLKVPWEITFVGAGPLEDELRVRADALELGERCRLETGAHRLMGRDEISDLYLSAAVVAVPSIWGDPAPLVRLEALAHGRPLVGFDSGGVASCIEEGINGFVVPRLDVDALASRIEQLLTDSALRERMGRAALQKAHDDHHPAKLAQRLEGIYAGLIGARAARANRS
jgi:glycosyltransferase involved in cell wall biosynthesis